MKKNIIVVSVASFLFSGTLLSQVQDNSTSRINKIPNTPNEKSNEEKQIIIQNKPVKSEAKKADEIKQENSILEGQPAKQKRQTDAMRKNNVTKEEK